MREEGVDVLLSKVGENWDTVYRLIEEHKLVETEYQGKKFYMRKLPIHSS